MRSISITTLVVALLGGCDPDTISHHTDAADGAVADGGAGSATISIHVQGDQRKTSFTDGLAGQTPGEYTMGLGRFELLRSATDSQPVTVFDHGAKPVQVKMLGKTLAGTARLADLTPGSYTHGRALLSSSSFTVAATVHAGLALPGQLQVTAALSDSTIDGKPWKQNQVSFTFSSGSIKHTVPGVLPPLPSTPVGTTVQQGGKTYLVFPLPAPLKVAPGPHPDSDITVVFKVFESFRWQDQTKPGFKKGTFDVDALGLSFEPVLSFGATGYGVEL